MYYTRRLQCRHLWGLMEDAGLKVRADAVGNTYGRWQGSDSSAGTLIAACDENASYL